MDTKNTDTLADKYIIKEKLGEGATANVYLVSEINKNDQDYAAKVLNEENEENDLFKQEVEMLQLVKSPYIANLIESGTGTLIRNGKPKHNKKYVVMELAGNGDLFSYIFHPQKGLGERYGKFVFYKILKGIQACHKAGICHRDLKMENILLDSEYNPKICDFGFATKLVDENGDDLLKEALGTRSYTAPEILAYKAYKGIPGDVFSLGVVMLTLVTCKIGFVEATKKDPYYRNIIVKKYDKYWSLVKPSIPDFDSLSEEFKNLFLQMISYKPNSRPTIEDVLKSDWMKEITDLNESQFKDLEKEVHNEFVNRNSLVEEGRRQEIQAQGADGEDDEGFRGVGDENKEYFSLDLKPQYGRTGVGMKDFMKVTGDFNPCTFMNRVANGIKNDKKEKCEIKESDKALKFVVTFQNEEKAEEEIQDELTAELAKIELEEKNEEVQGKENVQKKTNSIQLKLFESENGGYLLRFTKKSGDLDDYYNNLESIKNIIKEIS